jgi:DNA replication protein DnaC
LLPVAVYFTTSALLVQDLLVAKRDLKLGRFFKKPAHFERLIIDDLAYLQQSREEMEVLFTLPAERCGRGSVFISSHLLSSELKASSKTSMTKPAVIDRLVYHCVIPRAQHPELSI